MMLTAPEAKQIAQSLRETPHLRARLGEWKRRIRDAISRWRLRAKGPRRTYDCPFLEEGRLCALPAAVKPIGCLSYNPDRLRRCDHDPAGFWKAHDAVEGAWLRAGGENLGSVPIPVGVAWALGMKSGEGPVKAIRPTAAASGSPMMGPIPEAEPLGNPPRD